MAQNLELNPATRDYVIENGKPVPSDRILEKTYYALQIPQGKYLYGSPGQGSLCYTLRNELRDGSIDQRYAAYATDAVKRQLIDTGQAENVLVRNTAFTRTATENEIAVQAARIETSNQLAFISVG